MPGRGIASGVHVHFGFVTKLYLAARFALLLAAAAAPLTAVETAKPGTTNSFASILSATGLTLDQFLSGLKTGLGAAVDMASGDTSKAGAVQMNVPSSMAKLESMLKVANQTGAIRLLGQGRQAARYR